MRTALAFTLSGAPPPGLNGTFLVWPLKTTLSQSRSQSVNFLTILLFPTRSPKSVGLYVSTHCDLDATPPDGGGAAFTNCGTAGARASSGNMARNWASSNSVGHFFPFSFNSKYFLYFDVSSTLRPSSKREPITKCMMLPETPLITFAPAALALSSASARPKLSNSPVKHMLTPSSGRAFLPTGVATDPSFALAGCAMSRGQMVGQRLQP
mmetsp:Transcript_65772/g.174361  ORF Transcript_65772/g.174361 Transcript_65772/m.174361 type:complete len:210 (+) Transcript_65772:1649-2278(+)